MDDTASSMTRPDGVIYLRDRSCRHGTPPPGGMWRETSVASARQRLQPSRRIRRSELLGSFVPDSRQRDVWSETVHRAFLEHGRIIGSRKRQRRARIFSLGRTL